MSLSPDEIARYKRHILLKEIGGPGQAKLKAARVALVGAGGLGSPAALYLAAAGVGHLRIIDPDIVALDNLHRQILYREADVGRPKVEAAARELTALNRHVRVEPVQASLDEANAVDLLSGVDLVLDGCDVFHTRFVVNATAHALGLPLVSGAVGRFEGQVGTFASGLSKGLALGQRWPCYRCLVPAEAEAGARCDEMGIVGALTGVIGSSMAMAAVLEIAGAGEGLRGRLFLFEGLGFDARNVRLPPDPSCQVCGNPS